MTDDEVLNIYLEQASLARGRANRNGRNFSWSNSPLKRFKSLHKFNGTPMVDIPPEHRVPDTDPALIDRLQREWDVTYINKFLLRVRLRDAAQIPTDP